MNKQQRWLVLVAIASLAIGLHIWHYEYVSLTQWWPTGAFSRDREEGTILWWTWGTYDLHPDRYTNRWDLKVFPSGRKDHALLWGVIAPIAALSFGVFLVLGWRNKGKPPSFEQLNNKP